MAAYQIFPDGSISRELDEVIIPPDPANTDYQTYLAWVSAGNTPDASSLSDWQAYWLSLLEPQRLIVQSAGLQYTFPDGLQGIIQTRDPSIYQDLINIEGFSLLATVLISQLVLIMPAAFIDEANVAHTLTPNQAVQMGLAVGNFVSGTYTNKARIRININNTTLSNVTTFDITQGWS